MMRRRISSQDHYHYHNIIIFIMWDHFVKIRRPPTPPHLLENFRDACSIWVTNKIIVTITVFLHRILAQSYMSWWYYLNMIIIIPHWHIVPNIHNFSILNMVITVNLIIIIIVKKKRTSRLSCWSWWSWWRWWLLCLWSWWWQACGWRPVEPSSPGIRYTSHFCHPHCHHPHCHHHHPHLYRRHHELSKSSCSSFADTVDIWGHSPTIDFCWLGLTSEFPLFFAKSSSSSATIISWY